MEDNEIKLLKDREQTKHPNLTYILKFINSCLSICNEYQEHKFELNNRERSFNLFTIISDLYYRENFHSDLISFLLSPQENHGCGWQFLNIFISMLNKQGRSLNPNDYKDAVVIREEDKIDILIKSESSKKAIVIENKMNNAGDRPRQLPRYYDYVSSNYTIDAIVYIPLERSKFPDKSDWNDKDKEHIDKLLIVIPAYDKCNTNIVSDWLEPSILLTDNPDVQSTLRQYSKLITILNSNIMDSVIFEKFYKELLHNDNMKSACSIRDMLNELPSYLAQRIQYKFLSQCYPFSNIWIDKQYVVFERAMINGIYIKMDIECDESGYEIYFWSPKVKGTLENDFNNLVNSLKSLDGFKPCPQKQNHRHKKFDFKDEKGLYSFIESLLSELRLKMKC